MGCFVGSPLSIAGWTTHIYGPHVLLATAEGEAGLEREGRSGPERQVVESSGVVASRKNPDILWTHNDSGSKAIVWAFRLSSADRAASVARRMGSVQLVGASCRDWEDIASGPGQQVYILDGGDNPPCRRTDKRIHRFSEPTIDPQGSPIHINVPPSSLRFEYPDSADPSLPTDSNDARYDAETLFVHPGTGDIYIVTKRDHVGRGTARVYKLLSASVIWDDTTIHVLQFVADISSYVPTMPTGGDIDSDGRRVVIRNYFSAYEFTVSDAKQFDAIFQQPPLVLSMFGEVQGEGICYTSDGRDLISTSEVKFIGPQRLPFYIIPWELANLRVDTVRSHRAIIKWDTAKPLRSKVDYGTTTRYGASKSDERPVKAHVVELPSLSPATTYYYRAISDSLMYPPLTAANRFFLSTTQPASLDRP